MSVISSNKSVQSSDSSAISANSSVIAGGSTPPVNNDFVFSVDTSLGGGGNTYQLPFMNIGTVDVTLVHDDLVGSPLTITAYNDAATLLDFGSSGIFTGIVMTMNNDSILEAWQQANTGDKLKLIDISNWGKFDFSAFGAHFYGCSNLVGTYSDAPLISTSTLFRCFRACSKFVGSFEGWPTGSVANFGSVLQDASAHTGLGLPSLDTSSMTSCSFFALSANLLDQDLSSWDIGVLTNASTFISATMSTANGDALIIGWEGQPHQNNVTLSLGGTLLTAGGAVEAAYDALVADGWTITWGGTFSNTNFIFDVNTSLGGGGNTFQLPLVSADTLNFTITHASLVGSPVTITAYNDAATLLDFGSSGSFTDITCVMNSGTLLNGWSFNNGGDDMKLTNVSNVGDFDISEVGAFYGCGNLVWTATDSPAISSTSLSNTWRNDDNFNTDITSYPTGSVTIFNNMLRGCGDYDQSLAGLDITAMTGAGNMANGANLSTANYDATLIDWAGQSFNNNVTIHFGGATYTGGGAAATARATLVSAGWTITDGGIA